MAKIDATQFNRKFPFSTLIYFLWLYNIKLKSNLLSNLLILHSDSTWLKFQHYTSNCQIWQKSLSEYRKEAEALKYRRLFLPWPLADLLKEKELSGAVERKRNRISN